MTSAPVLEPSKAERVERLPSLDGLRGVAALSVVFGHAVLLWPVFWHAYEVSTWAASDAPLAVKLLTYTPLHALRASKEAVAIFFVLSGLVLTLPILNGRQTPYPSYLTRRAFRLLPVFWLAMALSVALVGWSAAYPQPTGSAWLSNFWQKQVTLKDLILTLTCVSLATDVDPPTWTLIHEIRISIIFPLLATLVLSRPKLTFVVTLCVNVALDVLRGRHFINLESFGSVLQTVQILPYFVAGIAIAKYRWVLSRWVLSLGNIGGLLLFCVGMTLLFSSWFMPIPPILFFFVGCVGAATMVIVSAFWKPAVSILTTGMCQFLGRISFSLYLLHLPIILLAIHIFGHEPRPAVVSIAICTAILLAFLVSHYVEWPVTNLGRRFAASVWPQKGKALATPTSA